MTVEQKRLQIIDITNQLIAQSLEIEVNENLCLTQKPTNTIATQTKTKQELYKIASCKVMSTQTDPIIELAQKPKK